MLSDLQMSQLDRAEQEWLRYPDEVDDYECKCKLCGEYPEHDMLYYVDGEWICVDCLLDQFPKKDIYTGEIFNKELF